MFNVTGGEVLILLVLALVVLGPEKLPEAVRRFAKVYGEVKKMSTGFQSELREALDEPVRELRETADMFKKSIEEPAGLIRDAVQGPADEMRKSVNDTVAAAQHAATAAADPFGNAAGFSAGPTTPAPPTTTTTTSSADSTPRPAPAFETVRLQPTTPAASTTAPASTNPFAPPSGPPVSVDPVVATGADLPAPPTDEGAATA